MQPPDYFAGFAVYTLGVSSERIAAISSACRYGAVAACRHRSVRSWWPGFHHRWQSSILALGQCFVVSACTSGSNRRCRGRGMVWCRLPAHIGRNVVTHQGSHEHLHRKFHRALASAHPVLRGSGLGFYCGLLIVRPGCRCHMVVFSAKAKSAHP